MISKKMNKILVIRMIIIMKIIKRNYKTFKKFQHINKRRWQYRTFILSTLDLEFNNRII